MLPPPETIAPSNAFQDRKGSLVVFGVLTVLMGGVCALMVLLMILGQSMAPQGSLGQTPHGVLPAVAMYTGVAVVFIWLGIGSINARRWARALLLVLAWNWLIIGIVSTVIMAFVLPKIMKTAMASAHPPGQPAPSADIGSFVMWFSMIILVIIYIIIPAVWVLFYRSKHVKATCEARDPVERWTDRRPLPVIAVCLWMALSAPMVLLMPLAFKGVLPVFGTFVGGPLGSALYVLLALIFGYAAWALYQLRWSGWWLIVIAFCLGAVSAFVTYSRHDIFEIYVLMGYSEQELAQIRQFDFLNGKVMAWSSLCGLVPVLGYMLYLRRYFPRASR